MVQRKTTVVKATAAPMFDESFSFPAAQDELSQRTLRLALWEQGKLSNHVLGEVRGGGDQGTCRALTPRQLT